MTEEKETLTPRARSGSPRKNRSVTVYLAILFAVAFLLLLLAYFMQQRNSEAMIGSLRDSMSNIESLNDLIDENQALRQEIDQLENQLSDAQDAAQQAAELAQQAAETAQQDARNTFDALLLLEQLEFLTSNQQLSEAAQLWDPQLETILPALDDSYQYAPGQLSLSERVNALKMTLFPDYAP